jgi:hypothetical protein
MRAPQYRRMTGPNVMPVGPNPAIKKGLRVEPFANIFALVENLGVISLHQSREDADAALAEYAKKPKAEGEHRPG